MLIAIAAGAILALAAVSLAALCALIGICRKNDRCNAELAIARRENVLPPTPEGFEEARPLSVIFAERDRL